MLNLCGQSTHLSCGAPVILQQFIRSTRDLADETCFTMSIQLLVRAFTCRIQTF